MGSFIDCGSLCRYEPLRAVLNDVLGQLVILGLVEVDAMGWHRLAEVPDVVDVAKFIVHYKTDRTVDWVGESVSQSPGRVRIQVCDAFQLSICGMWQLSDEVVEVPKSECRFFTTERAAAEACERANAHLRSR